MPQKMVALILPILFTTIFIILMIKNEVQISFGIVILEFLSFFPVMLIWVLMFCVLYGCDTGPAIPGCE
jgi:hypothetical protein